LQHLPPAAARLGDATAHNKALRVDDVGSVADAAGGSIGLGLLDAWCESAKSFVPSIYCRCLRQQRESCSRIGVSIF